MLIACTLDACDEKNTAGVLRVQGGWFIDFETLLDPSENFRGRIGQGMI